jgi:hypothetical protein
LFNNSIIFGVTASCAARMLNGMSNGFEREKAPVDLKVRLNETDSVCGFE